MYPLFARVHNQPPHSLLDRMTRISMITVRLQRLCFPTLSSLSKIGCAHSHVLLAEGGGLCGWPGVPDLTRSAFELSRIENQKLRTPLTKALITLNLISNTCQLPQALLIVSAKKIHHRPCPTSSPGLFLHHPSFLLRSAPTLYHQTPPAVATLSPLPR